MTNKVIAVTGGIGCGKSEVCSYLQSLGYKTLDCDVLAKNVSTRAETIEQVRQLLGDEYIVSGQLNRVAIRDKVFADESILRKYNAIFFDEVKKLLVERLAELDGLVFVEISVFDAFSYSWNEVWLVESATETRIDRAIARDDSSRKTVEDILSRQRICSKYTLKIDNNGSLSELKNQVDNALKRLSQ